MPTPYYDANDGFPSYLLINRGQGLFRDATHSAGLAEKRNRRTYSSSFYDADEDGDLDLLVVSDFSGVDIYENDGAGHFTGRSEDWIGERHNFGMGHAIADFDRDGKLDFFVTGMASTTARRLDAMGLARSDQHDITRMRTIMGYGNRMYLKRAGGFHESDSATALARTGWSWGTGAFDFDNDGDEDLYVANGHVSGESARDYCSHYWCHDIYSGNSKADPALNLVFDELKKEINGKWSWNGYEHNSLLMNTPTGSFTDVAFLLGVALECDCRSVVADDLDNDGRVDLLVLKLKRKGSALQVWRNELNEIGNWIGVDLVEQPGQTAIGAKVELLMGPSEQPRIAQIVTGDSYNAQHSSRVHFGLGDADEVETILVRWPNGTERRISRPELNRYHRITSARVEMALVEDHMPVTGRTDFSDDTEE